MQDFLREIIKRAGAISLEYRSRLGQLRVDRKSEKDLVTQADRSIEAYLVAEIGKRFPGHGILGEESGEHSGTGYRWIIDPVDGTSSFVHGQPFYSVSIGVEKEGELELGAVYAPALGELFEARRGQGAYLNAEPIHVSSERNLGDSMLGTGFACVREGLAHNNLPYFNRLVPMIRGVRRMGSAALDLCYVACGRFDGFWELNLNVYDVAAGFLMVREAGGRNSDFLGRERTTRDSCKTVLSSNGLIHDELLSILAAVKAEVEERS